MEGEAASDIASPSDYIVMQRIIARTSEADAGYRRSLSGRD